MESLYAPWRSNYTQSTEQRDTHQSAGDACIFCSQIQSNTDKEHFILKRCAHTCIMFNRYPYNAGHLLIVPLEHIAHMEHLSKNARCEMIELASASTIIFNSVAKPDGFNIGFNQGKAAGGSIPTHLHMHVLPRWHGDTSFLPTLSDTKVISFDLHALYENLKPHFDSLTL
jgi:ATP adenylyltransferase